MARMQGDGETEDPRPTPQKKNAPKTKKEEPAHGKSSKATPPKKTDKKRKSKATPPKKTVTKPAPKATPPKKPDTKPASKATPPQKPDKKPIDISDLAVLTKKTMLSTSRECFTSKAYQAARKRARDAGKSPEEMKIDARKAYAAAAASWDNLAEGS